MSMINYYIMRPLVDGRFIVFANHKNALDQETVDTYEEALKLLKVKRQQYIDFTKRQLKLKQE